MTGVFKQVETLLKDGHSVLVCGAPVKWPACAFSFAKSMRGW